VLTLNGVSKAYAMTGWRLGYAAGPADLIAAMAVVQSQSTSNACSISQAAAVEALDGPQDSVQERCAILESRRDFIFQAMAAIPGLRAIKPSGAFYLFVDAGRLLGKMTPLGASVGNDVEFCRHLLDERGVATIPGSCFGLDGYFRLSFASSMDELERGAKLIAEFCAELR
jgi:aspartate aminotransferase